MLGSELCRLLSASRTLTLFGTQRRTGKWPRGLLTVTPLEIAKKLLVKKPWHMFSKRRRRHASLNSLYRLYLSVCKVMLRLRLFKLIFFLSSRRHLGDRKSVV